MSIGELIKSADYKSEKHVPVIVLPEKITSGEPFKVEVSVGKEIAHPNTTEHFIGWIAVYFKPESGNLINVAKFDYTTHGEAAAGANQGPAYADPYSVFKMKTTQPGKLIATSYCNIHGLWESEVEVKF